MHVEEICDLITNPLSVQVPMETIPEITWEGQNWIELSLQKILMNCSLPHRNEKKKKTTYLQLSWYRNFQS